MMDHTHGLLPQDRVPAPLCIPHTQSSLKGIAILGVNHYPTLDFVLSIIILLTALMVLALISVWFTTWFKAQAIESAAVILNCTYPCVLI